MIKKIKVFIPTCIVYFNRIINSIIQFSISLWKNIEPAIELAIYILIAKAISIFGEVHFLWGIAIVFIYFILNIIRVKVR